MELTGQTVESTTIRLSGTGDTYSVTDGIATIGGDGTVISVGGSLYDADSTYAGSFSYTYKGSLSVSVSGSDDTSSLDISEEVNAAVREFISAIAEYYSTSTADDSSDTDDTSDTDAEETEETDTDSEETTEETDDTDTDDTDESGDSE